MAREHADAISALVGEGHFSEFVDEAVAVRLQHARIDQLLAEMDAEYGPVPDDIRKKAEKAWARLSRSIAARS